MRMSNIKAWIILIALSIIAVSIVGFVLTFFVCVFTNQMDQLSSLLNSPEYFLFEIVVGVILGTYIRHRLIFSAKQLKHKTVDDINKEIERLTHWCHAHGYDPEAHPMIIRLRKIQDQIKKQSK